jgi:exopolysaccharide production protein ExoZ
MNLSDTAIVRISIGPRKTADRVAAIEGLRGFAMILVFWGHFEVLFGYLLVRGSLSDQIVSVFSAWGHRGVSFFFVITGFFVYSKFMEYQTDYLTFVRKRLDRVVPLYWFMLVLYLALSFVVPSESKLPSDTREAVIFIAKNALFLQGFMAKPIMVVSWALTYLVLAYAGIPLVVTATRMRKWARWQRVIFILAGAGIWLAACRAYPLLSPRPVVIAVGLLVYEAIRTPSFLGRLSALSELFAACALGLSMVAWYAMDHHFLPLLDECRYLFLGVGLFAVYLHTFVYDGVLKKLFERQFLTNLGRKGYAYYLIHGLTIKAVITVVTALSFTPQKSSASFWILLPICFIATLCTSTLLHRAVDVPLRRVLTGERPTSPLKAAAFARLF